MSAAESLRIACAIGRVPGYSPSATAKGMLSFWGKSLNDLPTVTDAALQQAFGWKSTQVRAFRSLCEESTNEYQRVADRGTRVSTLLDPDPNAWHDRLTSVPLMFHRGDLSLLSKDLIGFSGSRDATDQALEVTRTIAKSAAEIGMTVISGGARGVDMAAHSAALSAGGSTIVLLPQGLDTWWVPPSLVDHADRVLVLSMDVPGAEWTTPSAMQRNRAIVDLSGIITIPQSGTTGGSHKTGLYALSGNRNLWVADLGDDYPGNQQLLQRGARPIPWNNDSPDFDLMRQPPSSKPAQQSLF